MWNDWRRFHRRPGWLIVLLVLTGACLVWAVVAWGRLRRAEAETLRRADRLPQVAESVEQLRALRVVQSAGTHAPARERQDLIPFLEAAAARAGISKEAMGLNTDSPKPVAGRPGLVEEETRVDLRTVSSESVVRFLSATEREFPGLLVREIVLTPVAPGQGWTANIRLTARVPARATPEARKP